MPRTPVLTCSLSPQDVELLEIPAELAALLQSAGGEKPSPSRTVLFPVYFLVS